MRNRLDSPDDIFKEGKRLLDKAGNDPDLLELCVQKIDAALLERCKKLYPSLHRKPQQQFNRLQTDRHTDAAGNAQISWGHGVRNMSAHARAHSLNRAHVDRYAVAVRTILEKTGSRLDTTRSHPNRKPDTPYIQPSRDVYPPAPVRYVDPLPQDILTLEPLEPVAVQPAASQENDDFLSQLLKMELGGMPPAGPAVEDTSPPADTSPKLTPDNDELLRQLLS